MKRLLGVATVAALFLVGASASVLASPESPSALGTTVPDVMGGPCTRPASHEAKALRHDARRVTLKGEIVPVPCTARHESSRKALDGERAMVGASVAQPAQSAIPTESRMFAVRQDEGCYELTAANGRTYRMEGATAAIDQNLARHRGESLKVKGVVSRHGDVDVINVASIDWNASATR